MITYDFRLQNKSGHTYLVNQKLTPLLLTKEGKIWKSLCVVSLSGNRVPGNIKIYKQKENKFWSYVPEGDFWEMKEKSSLNDREREILYLSTQGLTMNDIAKRIFISVDTVKFHRHKLFDKLGVTNIIEAISFAANSQLL
ncbi:response regulator transcription factor [Marinilabilia sp.]|uniref:response regulator transcription factor n=1 Tax=Marinilabilia sp. TaxID=2021252 RepID=UPI0025BA5A7A|nr:helix-turn-helix transcriptional regulator [Marinilabilia sp.]